MRLCDFDHRKRLLLKRMPSQKRSLKIRNQVAAVEKAQGPAADERVVAKDWDRAVKVVLGADGKVAEALVAANEAPEASGAAADLQVPPDQLSDLDQSAPDRA